MVGAAQIPPDWLRRSAPAIYGFGFVLLIAVLFFGVGAKGAQRWLDLPLLPRFQPSEVLKLGLPAMVAWFACNRAFPPRLWVIVVSLLIVFAPITLVILQPDLGTSILLSLSGLFALFLSGLQWRYIVAAIVLLISSLYPAWQFLLHDYQRQRVLTMLNPEADKLGAGWNIIQSKTAIGSGGLYGKGYLDGTQAHLNFLPETHTDFIIAVIAEEFGFRGVMLLTTLYLLIIFRCLWLSTKAQDNFGRLFAGSISLTFFVYLAVNMGMVSGVLPVVGVPLPMVSQGGTSLITLMLGFGCVMAISTQEQK